MKNPTVKNNVRVERDSEAIAAKRREQIVSAAVSLFAENGYFQTKIEDVSRKINIGKGLVYHYFKDKNDVLFYALCSVLAKYEGENVDQLMAEAGPLAALRTMLENNCLIAQEHTDEMALAYRSTKDLLPEQAQKIKEIESGIVAETRKCLEACIDLGLIAPMNTDIMAYQFVMFGHTWALKHWALRRKFSVAEYVTEGEKLLIVPFLTARGKKEYAKATAARSGAGK